MRAISCEAFGAPKCWPCAECRPRHRRPRQTRFAQNVAPLRSAGGIVCADLVSKLVRGSSHWTPPWSKPDSNHQYPARSPAFPCWRLSFVLPFGGGGSNGADMTPFRNLGRVTRYRWFESTPLQHAVENPGFSRGCAGYGRWCDRQRQGQAGDMAPGGDNVSVGPNSSTTVPVM
jgi:hypothetical protein